MDKKILENILALPPHTYPLWVKLVGIGIVIATLYSLALSPGYVVAAKKMHAAQAAYQARDYHGAVQLYRDVLEAVPSSKAARIGAAEAIFSNSDKEDDEVGLTLLQGITLDKEGWSRITRVMPTEYQQRFEDVKR